MAASARRARQQSRKSPETRRETAKDRGIDPHGGTRVYVEARLSRPTGERVRERSGFPQGEGGIPIRL
jgi:hypothetical protein